MDYFIPLSGAMEALLNPDSVTPSKGQAHDLQIPAGGERLYLAIPLTDFVRTRRPVGFYALGLNTQDWGTNKAGARPCFWAYLHLDPDKGSDELRRAFTVTLRLTTASKTTRLRKARDTLLVVLRRMMFVTVREGRERHGFESFARQLVAPSGPSVRRQHVTGYAVTPHMRGRVEVALPVALQERLRAARPLSPWTGLWRFGVRFYDADGPASGRAPELAWQETRHRATWNFISLGVVKMVGLDPTGVYATLSV
jgi:hypothetical protein